MRNGTSLTLTDPIIRAETTATGGRWGVPGYLSIADCSFDGTWFSVRFGNGDVIRVLPETLTPRVGCWNDVTIDEGDFLSVPSTNGPIELPATRLRMMTDPAYAAYIDWSFRHAVELIGWKLRWLREQSGISQADLARRIGLRRQHVWRYEAGLQEPGITVVGHWLGALGRRWDDLTVTVTDAAAYLAYQASTDGKTLGSRR